MLAVVYILRLVLVAVAGRDSSAVDWPVFYNTIAWIGAAGSHRASSQQYGMAMSVSSLVHWPLMGGLLHLVLVGSFGIHADYVYKLR